MKKISSFKEVIEGEVVEFVLLGNAIGWLWQDEIGEAKYGDFVTFAPDEKLTPEFVKNCMDILRSQVVNLIENGSVKAKENFKITLPLKNY